MFQIKLKQLRENANLSQAKLAQKLHIAQSTVGMWESGKNKPEYNTLLKIAEIFNVSIDYLTGGGDGPPSSTNGVWIPVLGKVQAGIPIEAVEEIIDYEEISKSMAEPVSYTHLDVYKRQGNDRKGNTKITQKRGMENHRRRKTSPSR